LSFPKSSIGNPKVFAEGDFFSLPRREGVPGFPAKPAIWQGGKGRGKLLSKEIFEGKATLTLTLSRQGRGEKEFRGERTSGIAKKKAHPSGHCEGRFVVWRGNLPFLKSGIATEQ